LSLWADGRTAGTPLWWADVERPEFSAEPPGKVDLLVVGAGYTGLSAALHAADAGASVAVLDAGQPGQGASTRNGGMFGAHPRLGWGAVRDRFGAEVADGVFAEAGPALEFAKSLIKSENIDCDLQRTGRLQLAWTKKQFAAQKDLAASVRQKSGVACRVLERGDLGAEIATRRYFGGILFEDHCGIHPAKFHAGLAASCLRRGVAVSGNCPVENISHAGTGFTVRHARGETRAGRVVLATNGYSDKYFKWLSARVFPLPSYLIATEEVDPARLRALAPGGRMMVETRIKHSYYRLSPDGRRVIFGGRAATVQMAPARAAARLHATMVDIWPALDDVKLTHAWTGNTGFTFNYLPHVGEVDGVHYAAGYSGGGTVLAPYLGAKVAWRALGDPRGATAYAGTRLGSRWYFRGGRPWFLHLAHFWYGQVRDRRENRGARR